jgi:uncharacterized protein YjbI with pentapeptide repeats
MDKKFLLDLIISGGVESWNAWKNDYLGRVRKGTARASESDDLSGANLSGLDLRGANFTATNLTDANLDGANASCAIFMGTTMNRVSFRGATLLHANLQGVNAQGADLTKANLRYSNCNGANLEDAILEDARLDQADFSNTHLDRARLFGAFMSMTNMSEASLRGADLTEARLFVSNFSNAHLEGAILRNCHVYGTSAWGVSTDEHTIEENLIITTPLEAELSVDNFEMAHFIYTLAHSREIRKAIDTITSKVVLILGRFSAERKPVLESLRRALRQPPFEYVPIVFDFDKPLSRDTHETITLLARLARFVVADITDAISIPQELVSIVQELPSLPVQPILLRGRKPWGMFDHISRYPWVLPVLDYDTEELAEGGLAKLVVIPAEAHIANDRKSRG